MTALSVVLRPASATALSALADSAVIAAMEQCARRCGTDGKSPTPDKEPLIEAVANVAEMPLEDAQDAIERLVLAGKLKVFRRIGGDTCLRIKLAK